MTGLLINAVYSVGAGRFLNERLSFGMAPDDIVGVFAQRTRWATGALTIMAVRGEQLCHVSSPGSDCRVCICAAAWAAAPRERWCR